MTNIQESRLLKWRILGRIFSTQVKTPMSKFQKWTTVINGGLGSKFVMGHRAQKDSPDDPELPEKYMTEPYLKWGDWFRHTLCMIPARCDLKTAWRVLQSLMEEGLPGTTSWQGEQTRGRQIDWGSMEREGGRDEEKEEGHLTYKLRAKLLNRVDTQLSH